MQKITFYIKGIHCKACKALIEDVCSEIPGVHSSNVNYGTGETIIEHDENLDFENLKNEIQGLGNYQVEI